MPLIKLKDLNLSFRLFLSSILCLVGISYVMLLSSIWIDTEMKIANIIEGYGSFEFMELVEHTFRYIFWFIGTFTITLSLFLLTSWPENLKRIFALVVPLLIISDMGSMWLIRYSDFFATQLFISGSALAACFLVLFVLIQYDLWQAAFQRANRRVVSKKVSVVAEKILKILDESSDPVNVKEIDFRLHFEHAVELIYMSLGWLVREGLICAEARGTDTYMVRPNSKAHKKQECNGTHKWIKDLEKELDLTTIKK